MWVPKPKRIVVIEETFMVLKPDVCERHSEILDALYHAGFQVTLKKMPVTRTLIQTIVNYYPAPKEHKNSRISLDEHLAFMKASEPSTLNRRGSMTQSTRAVEYVPASSIINSQAAASERASEMAKARYKELCDFLLRGTTLALVLSAENAVERALELAGPEDPDTAKSVAPSSLRAVFGTDPIRNAVFCAPTHEAAAHLIHAVFEYETKSKTEVVKEGKKKQTNAPNNGVDVSLARAEDEFDLGDFDMAPTLGETYYTEEVALSPDQLDIARHEIAADRAALKREERLLHLREMDLLLREKNLQREMDSITAMTKVNQSTVAESRPGRTGKALAKQKPSIVCKGLSMADIDACITDQHKLVSIFRDFPGGSTEGTVSRDDFIEFSKATVGKDLEREVESLIRNKMRSFRGDSGLSFDQFSLLVMSLAQAY